MAMASRFLLQLHHTGGITSTVIPAVARLNSQLGYNHVPRGFHSSSAFCKSKSDSANFQEIVTHAIEQKSTSLVTDNDLFKQAARDAKSKASFNRVLDVFIKRDIRRRGHVEFIYAALKKMPEFGVERDITIYNKLLDVFPKEVFVPSNYIQVMFLHYPRQQECGVQVLEQMEHYGVMPNMETKVLLVQIFGEKGEPFRKYQRLMYWFPKFKNLNPFPVPHQLPQDPMDLARYSLTHIANDLDAKITVYQFPTTDITDAGEEVTHPYILGIQSPDQRSLLAKHSPKRPVFVEGPFPLWLRNICVHYYLLRADPVPPEEQIEEELDPEMVGPGQSFFYPHYIDLDLMRDLGDDDCFDVDEVVEGPVYAMCMTEQGDQATLAKWISGLQENNPILGKVPTVFRLESGFRELQKVENIPHDSGQNEHPKHEAVHIIDEEVLHSQGMKQ